MFPAANRPPGRLPEVGLGDGGAGRYELLGEARELDAGALAGDKLHGSVWCHRPLHELGVVTPEMGDELQLEVTVGDQREHPVRLVGVLELLVDLLHARSLPRAP